MPSSVSTYIYSCSLTFSHRPDEVASIWRLRKLVYFNVNPIYTKPNSHGQLSFVDKISNTNQFYAIDSLLHWQSCHTQTRDVKINMMEVLQPVLAGQFSILYSTTSIYVTSTEQPLVMPWLWVLSGWRIKSPHRVLFGSMRECQPIICDHEFSVVVTGSVDTVPRHMSATGTSVKRPPCHPWTLGHVLLDVRWREILLNRSSTNNHTSQTRLTWCVLLVSTWDINVSAITRNFFCAKSLCFREFWSIESKAKGTYRIILMTYRLVWNNEFIYW